MAYGLQIENPSGQLVISSEALGLFCYGKFSAYSSVGVSGTATSSAPGRQAGYQTYRLTTGNSDPIIIAMDLPSGVKVGIRSVTYIGSGVWELEAHSGDTADSDGFDTNEFYTDFWAYKSYSSSLSGSYGLALYDSSGTLTFDSNQGVPLMARDYVAGTGGLGSNFTISSLTKPAIIGYTPTNDTFVQHPGANTWNVIRRRGCWVRSGTTVTKTTYTDQQYRVFGPDAPDSEDGIFDQPGFTVEGAHLP